MIDKNSRDQAHARCLRAAIAIYNEPMGVELVAIVIRDRGQSGLDQLLVTWAGYVKELETELAVIAARSV